MSAGLDNADWLQEMQGKSGVYIISFNRPASVSERFFVKIGMAKHVKREKPAQGRAPRESSMRTRLESYMLYYPTGYYIMGIVHTQRPSQAKPLEREMHEYLTAKDRHISVEYPNSTHTSEWYWISVEEIDVLLHLFAHPLPSNKAVYFYRTPYKLSTNVADGKFRHRVKPMTEEQKVEVQSGAARIIESGKKARRPSPHTRSRVRALKLDDDAEENSE